MSQPVPPPGTFVLRRPEYLEKQARQGITVALISQYVVLVLLVAMLGLLTVLALTTSYWIFGGVVVVLAAVFGTARSVRTLSKWRRVERGLGGMELWIAPEGLTYVTVAGRFSAPWSALRAIYFQARGRRRIEALFVDVDGWGGPLAAYAENGAPCSLRMPLHGLGADKPTIARAVHEISSGRAAVGPG